MTATISAKLVAELRSRTGAGMMDCKKALEETNGSMDQAIDLLRKKGITKAEKRAGRVAAEGQIVAQLDADGRTGVLVEVNCETDFVARTDEFKKLVASIAAHVAQDKNVDGMVNVGADDVFLGTAWSQGGAATVGDVVKAASAKTGENIVLRRVARFACGGHRRLLPASQRQGGGARGGRWWLRSGGCAARVFHRRARRRGRPRGGACRGQGWRRRTYGRA